MGLLGFIWRRLTALASTIILLALILVVFVALRVFAPAQVDDSERVAAKKDYLEEIASRASDIADRPNIVFVLYDDLGYGDIGYGARESNMIATPNIDDLAAGGVVLSDFHAPAPVCTPSRAGYLTGRLAPRAGLPNVVFPTGSGKEFFFHTLTGGGNKRLPAEEITLADLLRAAGYATGMIGKWHLGDRSPSLPNDMGFESYFGALYSNDMQPFAFYKNREIAIEAPIDQTLMTQQYTEAAVSFIRDTGGQPFFLYFAHNFPHDPLHVSDARSGRSNAGLFGDVVEELDESIGTLVRTLRDTGQLENTLFIITSDNGPWYLGDAGNQRGRKGNTFEGGTRVPFIAHWPQGIRPGRIESAMAMGTDLLPTVLELLQLPAPRDRIIDGKSILAVLTEGGDTPHDYLYYYDGETLFAVRDQRFKYRGPAGVFYSTDQMPFGAAVAQKEWLFDLAGDPRESYDTSTHHPQELARLRTAFEQKRASMAENQRGWR